MNYKKLRSHELGVGTGVNCWRSLSSLLRGVFRGLRGPVFRNDRFQLFCENPQSCGIILRSHHFGQLTEAGCITISHKPSHSKTIHTDTDRRLFNLGHFP